MNEYSRDGIANLRRAVLLIAKKMTLSEIHDATLFAAIGLERLMKAVLWEINPIYVLKDQRFENTVGALYRSRLVRDRKTGTKIPPVADDNVIGFGGALYRAKEFSKTVQEHFAALRELSRMRDVIAHRPLQEFDEEHARRLLLESLFPIAESLCDELVIPREELGDNFIPGLQHLSKKLSEKTRDKLLQKLRFHRMQWEDKRSDPKHAAEIHKLEQLYHEKSISSETSCPACGNYAEVFFEPDYDYSDGQSWVAGMYPTGMECKFCGLDLSDYDELDYVNAITRLPDNDIFDQ